MRTVRTSIVIATLFAVTAGWPQGQSGGSAPRLLPGPQRETTDADVTGLLRYEPTGLSLLGPYRRGRVPVVFVHGLWSGP
jgi:hypothetical protein